MHTKLLCFAVVLLAFAAMPASADTTFRCESQDGKYHECRVTVPGTVALAKQVSDSACIEGRTWGFRNGVLWVDHGCRADFTLSTPLNSFVQCESVDGKPARCVADTGAGVRLVRQLSDSECRYGRDWGYDGNGIWVMSGCRAEFAVRAPMRASMVTCSSDNENPERCRAETAYGVSLHRQISDAPCVLNETWGYDQNGIWVREGCRGEFVVGTLPAVMTSSLTANPIVCESVDGRRAHCAMDTTAGVRLIRQISETDCQFNRTWGYDEHGIWVTGGCRGEFVLGGAPPPASTLTSTIGRAPQAASVVCESEDGKRKVCPADTRMGVAVVKQLSDSDCVLNSTWGYDSTGIWVTAGCRAEFILRR
jgi:hypothetical protein